MSVSVCAGKELIVGSSVPCLSSLEYSLLSMDFWTHSFLMSAPIGVVGKAESQQTKQARDDPLPTHRSAQYCFILFQLTPNSHSNQTATARLLRVSYYRKCLIRQSFPPYNAPVKRVAVAQIATKQATHGVKVVHLYSLVLHFKRHNSSHLFFCFVFFSDDTNAFAKVPEMISTIHSQSTPNHPTRHKAV